MRRRNLEIILKSDFCTATGESIPGLLNSRTALEHGVPYIPAKRVKGCLLEAGRELAAHGIIKEELLYRIFGTPGMEQGGAICIGDAHIHSVPGYLLKPESTEQIPAGDYERLQRLLKEYPGTEMSLVEEIFTRNRTRTALEKETGTAKEHSLRTFQVVPAGIIFSCRIEGELNREEEEALQLCARGLRHMGIGITRGMGEVCCRLYGEESETECETEKTTEAEISGLSDFRDEDEMTLAYEVELESPVIMASTGEESADQIPANAILGALAGMYVKRHSLGENAHEDEDFRRIFLRDGVQFGNAFLKKEGIQFVPAPKAFAMPKEDKERWFNIMADTQNLRRKNISGQIFLEDTSLYTASPKKEIHFHHARPADRGIGHALNDRAEDTSAPTGQFFQYIALSKGQTFAGSWKGKGRDLRELAVCLEQNQYRLKLGRSKTAEYGNCRIRIIRDTSDRNQENHSAKGKEWLVWLLSPLVFRNPQNGEYETDKEWLKGQMKEKLKGITIEISDAICGYTVVDGYNAKWRLPMQACPAFSAGSSFYIKADREIEARELEDVRWGMLTGKGCGQIKAVLWENCQQGDLRKESFPASRSLVKSPEENHTVLTEKDQLFSAIQDNLERRKQKQETALNALVTVEKQIISLPTTSELTLLLQILREMPDRDNWYTQIDKETEPICGEEKRERIRQYVRLHKNESYEFITQYLEAAKWKARMEE